MNENESRSIEELVAEAQKAGAGDHRAFSELVTRHQGRVLTNCRFISRSDSDAEDLAQDVFLKAFFGLKKLKKRSTFTAWIQRIKINHCLNFIKRNKDKDFVELDSHAARTSEELQVAEPASVDLERRVRQKKIWDVLSAMPDNLRLPLILCDMDGLSYQEAADELDIGLSALKMRLKRGREFFRTRFAKASR